MYLQNGERFSEDQSPKHLTIYSTDKSTNLITMKAHKLLVYNNFM